MELYEGRPAEGTGRLPREMRTYDFLDGLGIRYLRTDHERADNMAACNEIDAVLDVVICKNLFLCNRQKTNFYLLLMPGDKPFKTKEITKQIGSARLSFGPEEYMWEYMNCRQGSASVLGLMNDTDKHVRLLIDEDLKKNPYIGAHPCNNTSTLKLHTSDIFGKFLEKVGHEATYVKLKGEA
jgi:Ala-tRNA(Pro) deacylase